MARDPNSPISIKEPRIRRQNRVFYTAVVADFYSNPASLSSTRRAELKGAGAGTSPSATNSQFVDRMPRNSILAYIVSDRKGKFDQPFIFYPFFSPHLCLPVKPGEQVWVIFETLSGDDTLGYWITRKCVDYDVDDINFTHADRMVQKFDTLDPMNTEADVLMGAAAEALFSDPEFFGDEHDDDTGIKPSFPNGSTGTPGSRTLARRKQYDEIIANSTAYGKDGDVNQFIGEPVPRFSKAVGDLVLQGSNNAIIVLGTERWGQINTGPADYGDESYNPFPGGLPSPNQGAIDIVVGRGQSSETAGASTPEGVINERGYHEIPKRPSVEIPGSEENLSEGDPDITYDAARIHLGTGGDGNPHILLKTQEIDLVAHTRLTITVGEATVIVYEDGNIVFTPGPDGVIKLGGDDADKALITAPSVKTQRSGGTVSIPTPLATTAGGAVGVADEVATSFNLSTYATRILVK